MTANHGWLKGMNPVTTVISMVIITAFVLAGVFFTEQSAAVFNAISGWILDYLKWYYIGIVAVFLFFCIWLAFISRWR